MGPMIPDGKGSSASTRLNKRTEFWDEYSKFAKEYDGELVKDLGDDLNSLLTFAGLFSATNTAFILEAMKDLKEDTTQTTNDLLRSIAHGLRDPNFSYENAPTPTFAVSRRAIRINALLFASLCCSLFTALGAILGKQWLNHYANEGPIKLLPEKSRERQKKLMGLERWYLEAILQTLPTLIQFSLFFFLVALVDYLWELEGTVAAVVLTFSALTLMFYATTIIISVCDPASPFQNRFTLFLRTVIMALITRSRLVIPWVKKSARNLRIAAKKHGYHLAWTWIIVIFTVHHPNFDYIVVALTPEEYFFFFPGVFFLGPVRYMAKSAHLRWLSGLLDSFWENSPDPIETEVPEDVLGAECVAWLWRYRSTDARADDAVLDIAGILNPADISRTGYLGLLISVLLKPVSDNGVVTSLNVDIHQLRDFLGPLSRWISQETPYFIDITEEEDSPVFSIWRHLGSKLWKLLVDHPDDTAAVQSIACIVKVVDSLYGRFRWNLSTLEESETYIKNAMHIQDLVRSAAMRSSTDPIIADYLTILGCVYWGCSEIQREHLLSLESATYMRSALISTVIHQDNPDKDQWRGRLRLLCLQETHKSPSLFYLPLKDEADRFSHSLKRWVGAERSINLRWTTHWLRTHRHTPIHLYLATIRLLLVNDFDLWHLKLEGAGHSEFIRRLMTSCGTEKYFSWQWKGKKLLPLECVLSVWHHHYRINPESEGSQAYLTPGWVQSIMAAVDYLGSIKSVPEVERPEFSACMMESELLIDMLVSLREYIRVAVSFGFVSQQSIGTTVGSYQVIGGVLQDWVRTRFVTEPDGYQHDSWRTSWRTRIQEQCEIVTRWSRGLVEQV